MLKVVVDLSCHKAYLGEIGLLLGFVEILPESRVDFRLPFLDCSPELLELGFPEAQVQGRVSLEKRSLAFYKLVDLFFWSACHFFLPV